MPRRGIPDRRLGASTVRVTLEFILSCRCECCDRFCERELQACRLYILLSETQSLSRITAIPIQPKILRIAKLDDQRASVAVLRRMARTASMTKQNNGGKDMGDSNTVANSFSAGVRPTLDLVDEAPRTTISGTLSPRSGMLAWSGK